MKRLLHSVIHWCGDRVREREREKICQMITAVLMYPQRRIDWISKIIWMKIILAHTAARNHVIISFPNSRTAPCDYRRLSERQGTPTPGSSLVSLFQKRIARWGSTLPLSSNRQSCIHYFQPPTQGSRVGRHTRMRIDVKPNLWYRVYLCMRSRKRQRCFAVLLCCACYWKFCTMTRVKRAAIFISLSTIGA